MRKGKDVKLKRENLPYANSILGLIKVVRQW